PEHWSREPHAPTQLARASLVVPAPRPVTGYRQHRSRVARQDTRHRVEQRAETVPWLDAAQEEQPVVIGEGVGPAAVRSEEGRVHAVGDDIPTRAEIARVRVHHRLAHRNRRRMAVEDPLQWSLEYAAPDRAREPRVERRDDRDPGTPGGERRREPEDGREPTVHVHDVVAASPEHLLQSATQLPPG